MKVQNIYLAGITLLLIGGVSIQVRKQSQPSQVKPQDQVVSSVLDQVEPLCRTLLPDQTTLHFNVSRQSAYSEVSGERPIWAVDCMDANKHHLMHLLWDSDMNRLVFMSRQESDDEHKGKAGHAVEGKQALVKAQKWASALHIASESELARCASTVHTNGDILFVRLFPSSGEVMVWFNARSGNIVNTHIRRTDSLSVGRRTPSFIATDRAIPPKA